MVVTRSAVVETLDAMHIRFSSVPVLIVLLLAPTYAYFYQSTQHNEAARFDQARAILEERRFAIDSFRWNTADVALYTVNGVEHVFPAKAPGSSFLALIPMWITKHIARLVGTPEWLVWHLVAYACTVLAVGIPSALAAVAMYDIIVRMTKARAASLWAMVAIWLGSILFPFSTLYFGHAQTVALLIGAFWMLFRFRHEAVGHFRRPLAMLSLAGLMTGYAVFNEYPAIFGALFLSLYLALTLWQRRAHQRLTLVADASFAAGALGMALVLLSYNYMAFGKFLFSPYQALGATGFTGATLGFAGIHWPGWDVFVHVLAETLIRPQRGLLYLCPVLALAVPGFIVWYRHRAFRLELAFTLAITATYIVFNACYGDSIVYWGGGTSVGPRQLLLMIPFLALPLAFIAKYMRRAFLAVLTVSVFFMLLATAVEPRVPYDYTNPVKTYFIPHFISGTFGLNTDALFDSEHHMIVGSATAFNMGGLVRLPGIVQLAPLVAWWAYIAVLMRHALRRRRMAS
jgi:hypothetical protein